MRAYLDQSLDGLTSGTTSSANILCDDYVTEDDIRCLKAERAAIVSGMQKAVARGDLERFSQLDLLHDELQAVLDEMISFWPDDYLDDTLEGTGAL